MSDLIYWAEAIWSAIARNIQWLAPTAANGALVIIGWRVARSVQRKQLATTLFSTFRYQETWLKASKAVYEKLERDRGFDWSNLARGYYERQLSDEDEQLHENARMVLNLYEADISRRVDKGRRRENGS
jgi:hypothetical protein